MIRKILPAVLIVGLIILACILQACSAATPAPVHAYAPPVYTNSKTSEPSVTRTAVPIPTSTRIHLALPVLASPELARIAFQDENNGWGIATNDNGYVLRTVDGGSSWLNATPPGIGNIGLSAVLTVLDTDTVWVLVPSTDFFSGTLYRTSDGGLLWNSYPVPFGAAFIQFQDGMHGRALAEYGAAAGSEAVELFQSSDGGATWSSVFHDDPNQPGSSDSLPLAGIKNGMTFLDASTGWVTGSVPAAGEVYLYVTHDGGVTWSKQSLPLPAGYERYQYVPQAPVFFGKDGFLPLMVNLPDRVNLTIFVTQDGGLTWSGNPGEASKVIQPGLTAFADAQYAWSWDGGPQLYFTTDGAEIWQTASSSLNISGHLSQLEFVAASTGQFTGWALTRTDEAGHSQLYRTRDGINWTSLLTQ